MRNLAAFAVSLAILATAVATVALALVVLLPPIPVAHDPSGDAARMLCAAQWLDHSFNEEMRTGAVPGPAEQAAWLADCVLQTTKGAP